MELKDKENLRQNRVEFVKNLEATDILDYLLEDGILTENDCELISNTKTRKERAQLLLAMLPKRGPNAYGSFQRALNQGKYQFLEEKLSNNFIGSTKTAKTDDQTISRNSEDLRRCMELASNCKNRKLKIVLISHVFLLVDNIEPIDIVDHFFQENIITDDGIEVIKTSKTRKERCFALLSELSKSCSDIVVEVLCKSVSKKYNFITQAIKKVLDQNSKSEETEDENRNIEHARVNVNFDHTHLKESRGRIENAALCTETHLKSVSQTEQSSVTSLKEINNREDVACYDENSYEFTSLFSNGTEGTENKKPHLERRKDETRNDQYARLNDVGRVCVKGSYGPVENMEICTETHLNLESQTNMLSMTPLKEINNRESVACYINTSEFTTPLYLNGTEHTEDYIENVFTNAKEPCENESCSSMYTASSSTSESNLIGNSTITLNSECSELTLPTSRELSNSDCETVPKNLENAEARKDRKPKGSVKLFDADQSILCSNEADGTAVFQRELFQSNRPILMTMTSTDSESENTITKKTRKKPKSNRRNIDIGNSMSSSTWYCSHSSTNQFRPVTETDMFDTNDKKTIPEKDKILEHSSNTLLDSGISLAKEHSVVNYRPGGTTASLSGKHLVLTFNYLSTLINQGKYDKFELFSSNIHHKYFKDPDMQCLLGYLHASRDLYKTDFDSAKKHIDKAFEIVPQTSNPKYFTLELFTTKTRMYISQKKLEKLQNALDDAKMIIETDPLGCTGRASGWLYMNDARNCTAQIGLLNFRNPKAIISYTKLHNRAKSSFQKALTNFDRDGGKDGPFGFGYALCRLAILLLRCSDNGRTMEILLPPEDDVKLAGGYLQKLEDSEIAIPKILEMHFVLAKSDYQYRRRNTTRALDYAELAYTIASEMNLLEFTEHAHNRCVFLRTKQHIVVEDITEEEFKSIIFGEQTEQTQQSDTQSD